LTIPAASLAETEERLLRMEQADRRPETRRSSFYGSDPMARRAVEVRGAEVERRLAVPADVFYSAEWLVPGVARPLGGGTLTEFVGMEQARRFQGAMARPFDRIQVALKPGFTARPGEELQIFRIVRQTSGLGWVAKPTGSATVVADEGESLVVEVNRQFAPIALGDHVRALPIFPLEPGQHPSDVTLGSASATLIEWGDPHQLQQYGDVAFLDVGANDGVAVGDEYVVAARTAQGFNSDIAGRLQVVGVGDDVSSARIIQQDGPVFSKGTEVFLARKMR